MKIYSCMHCLLSSSAFSFGFASTHNPPARPARDTNPARTATGPGERTLAASSAIPGWRLAGIGQPPRRSSVSGLRLSSYEPLLEVARYGSRQVPGSAGEVLV